MKKGLGLLIIGLVMLGVAGTALAAANDTTPVPDTSSPDYYQQMYNACHGPNGYMSKYFGSGNQQQNYGGMMGGYGGMMRGYGSYNQSGI